MFQITPSRELALQARLAQHVKVLKSLAYLMNECVKKLHIKNEKIQLALKGLLNVSFISPELHYLHHALQNSMRRQHISSIVKNIHKISDLINTPRPNSEWITVSSVGDSEWESFVTSETIRLTREDCGFEAEILPIDPYELLIAKDVVNAALNTLSKFDPMILDEIHIQVKEIKLFQGKITMGLTDMRILGAMLIRIPRNNINALYYFIEHIVHETSHIHLNCLMSIDPLILNLRDEKFESPIRSDPRPMLGVFHATFVSARVARTLIKIYQANKDENLLQAIAETLSETIRGINVIEKYAKLTPNGKELVSSINNLICEAKIFPEWKIYPFLERKVHRFGSGTTEVSALERAVS